MSRFIPGVGPINAKIMIVGEAPGYYEDQEGLPFVGASGSYLNNHLLYPNGLSREEVYITNVVKHRPPANDFRKINEVCNYDEQIQILKAEIKAINPNVIIALGQEAVYALTGRKVKMKEIRGSILPSQYGPKVVATYHPAALLRSSSKEGTGRGALPYWIRNVVAFDFKRAIEQSRFPAYTPPLRTIKIAQSSMDVYNFLSRNEGKEYNSTDIEAFNCVPCCIGFSCHKNEAISIPLFQSLFGIEITTIPHRDLAEIWILIAKEFESKRKIIGQNFKYDQDKLRRLGFKINNFYFDTMLAAHTLNPEFYKSLAFSTSMYTEEPYYKDEGKTFNPKKDKISKLLNYNGLDSCCTLEIALEQMKELEEDGLKNFYFNYVHLLHDLYLEIENVGFKINFDRRRELGKMYNRKAKELLTRMKDVLEQYEFKVKEFNPRSPKQVAFALYEVLGIPKRKGTSEETLFALLANTVKEEPKKVFIKSVLDYRKVSKTKGTYIKAKPDYDRRMRTSVRITGTETGRSSTAKMKAPIRPDKIGIALQTMTKHGQIGADLRSMYIPDEGFIFLEVDFSQAEPRIVALLSKDDDLMSKFGVIDVHSWTAELALSIPLKDIKKGSGERHIGKTLRNAGNYRIGKHEFMLHCNTDAAKYEVKNWQDISEWKAGQLLNKFHEFTPKVEGVYHKELIEIVRSTRVLINPFGRKRTFWGDLEEDKTFKEASAQIPQSTTIDALRHAMLDAKKEAPELQILLESHDACLMQVPINDAEKYRNLLCTLMERPIDFSSCSLKRGILYPKAEAQLGENWKDLRDFK